MSSSSHNTAFTSFWEYWSSMNLPLDVIQSATNNFADENLLKKGTSFEVYKGQLLQSGDLIDIVARQALDASVMLREMIFARILKHKNIVSTFKISFYVDKECIMINKHEANGSLAEHLSGPTLTWKQRLHICVEIARVLKYLHNDVEDDEYIVHGNIKPSKVLLDHDWEPKLNGFGLAVKAKKHTIHRITIYKGSPQHMDPTYDYTLVLTHKSDVFSFGVMLFEVLFGREAYIQDNDNWYFARLARSHYEDRKLDDLIDPDLRKQMNMQSFNIFVKTAYYCLKEHRSQRPDMKQVLSKLEKALEHQDKHEHPSADDAEGEGTLSLNYLKVKNLDHLKFRKRDIVLATKNFSKTCCIGSGGYGQVYKAQLDLKENLLAIDGKTEGKLPKHYNKSTLQWRRQSHILKVKKPSTVAIKRIFSRNDEQGKQGFLAEIETLSNCKHPNIVSLHGFCDEGDEMILVYEYVSKGSLADYLGNHDNMTNLTWAQRIQICLDIAHGLKYLHTSTKDKKIITHRDIKSANILLDDNWVAKIADFGLSRLHCANQQGSTLVTNNIAGTEVYLDPEYMSTGKLKTKSDVYSFGVVLFEIMCGKLAYDKIYGPEGLPSVARQCLNEGTLNYLIDPNILEDDENVPMLIGGAKQDSLDTFKKIACRCLAETQSERPTMEVIIEDLTRALNLQKTYKNSFYMSLEAIKSGTKDFSNDNCIGEGKLWKLYEGEVAHTPFFIKRWDKKSPQALGYFLTELDVLFASKNDNIVTLAGYCIEMDENIIVYEHVSNGKLDKYLRDSSLTWKKRIKICINVAAGLEFLHKGGFLHEDSMMHRDIKSSSILLDGDWNGKISNLEFSRKSWVLDTPEHVDDNDCNSLGYIDPEYQTTGMLVQVSDIYSLGVILTEMLCGRSAWFEGCVDHSQSLGPLVVRHYKENGNLNKMIFEGIKEQIEPQSLNTFLWIALQCLDTSLNRPSASVVVIQLTKALKFQEDNEIWEPKLPIDYKEIIRMSKYSEIDNSTTTKKDLYDMLSTGILLQDSKVLFSLGSNGERNEMISARIFTYKNRTSYRWQSVQESRFSKVAEITDISKLKIRIKITTQLLSLDVNYGAYVIFKFCDTRKYSTKPMYMNLKYKKGEEKLHAYFATWRDDKWMMVELCRFLAHKKDIYFEVLLESFSQYYCGKGSIYVEGIEFRVIDNVKKELQQTPESNSNKDQLLSLNGVNQKSDLILSAKEVVYDSSNVKHFHLKPSTDSRFKEVLELLPRQVFRIKCKIQSQMLSQDTEYLCYLVFKLSEKCRGLHCPVKVRDLLHRNNKEADIIYFRSPDPWNLHENISVPKRREDGWMEVKVWKFNSNHQLKNGCVPVNLKFITYEGTMSGLIVCGLEFRSM